MPFLNALAAGFLCHMYGCDTKWASISRALGELCVTFCVANKLVNREDLHLYAAAGDAHARMGMHISTADVTSILVSVCHACFNTDFTRYNSFIHPSIKRKTQVKMTCFSKLGAKLHNALV
jgi:hypothetical protein